MNVFGRVAAVLALACVAPAALSYEDVAPNVRVMFDGVEPEVPGLLVQVYDDPLAPQLVLDNRTGRAVEILDDKGKRLLSIRPQASWGWFDKRLDTRRVRVPEQDKHVPVVLQEWRVPARLGRERIELRGHFRYEPPPPGVYVARLTSARELAPAVSVTLSTGQPPALLLENDGTQPVVVLGHQGEPFLRISERGVEANLASPTWQELGRYRGLATGKVGKTRWRRVAEVPRYSWLEPRAGQPVPGEASRHWEVPVRIGGRDAAIQGVTEWRPAVY